MKTLVAALLHLHERYPSQSNPVCLFCCWLGHSGSQRKQCNTNMQTHGETHSPSVPAPAPALVTSPLRYLYRLNGWCGHFTERISHHSPAFVAAQKATYILKAGTHSIIF